MTAKSINKVFLAVGILIIPFFVAPVRAQQAAGSEAPENGLAEIVVTAQRKEESVLAVPQSVQAFSGDQLTNVAIQTFTDLAFVTPGLLAQTASGFTEIYLRGLGNGVVNGADPSVATFVDDVPRIYGSSTDSLVDVDRVEVLKGAQGGLYGRNADGGVINVITRQPNTDKLAGNVLLDGGSYSTFRGTGYINVPLTGNLAFNLAVERDKHDAYSTNDVTLNPYTAAMFPGNTSLGTPQQTASYLNKTVYDSPVDDRDFWATNGKLLFKLDNFKLTLAADYTYKNDSAGDAYDKQAPAVTQAVLSGILTSFGIANNLPPGFEHAGNEKFDVSLGDRLMNAIEEYGESATAVWNAPGVELTSISAYRRSLTNFTAGAFGSTAPDVTAGPIRNYRHYWYQELRAASTWDGPFHFLGGATYLLSDVTSVTNIVYFPTYVAPPLAATPESLVTDAVHNWSVYAQGTYDITHNLNLTVSGRYVHETNGASFILPVTAGTSSTEDAFLPSATLSYKLDDGNVYARYAKGFKAGGVNVTAAPIYFPNINEGSVFGPEHVDTYEVGYRQGLFDRKLELTTALFYNRVQGLQVSDSAQPAYEAKISIAFVNAGTARTYGAEETLRWRVIEPLTLGVSADVLNAKYEQFQIVNNPVLVNFDLSHSTMLDAPNLQASFTADLDQPLTDGLHLVGHGLVTHISQVIYSQSGGTGLPPAVAPEYWLTSLRLGVATSDQKYSLVAFANNLFNTGYYTWGTSSAGTTMLAWGNPRIIGAEFTAAF